MKTQITVEIPDGYEITSLCRGKQYGEYDDRSAAIPHTIHIQPVKPFIINGVPSDWPDWLTWDWVAADDHGRVYGYNDVKPFLAQQCYACGRGTVHHGSLFGIDIKIPGPWEQSLRENPRRKNKEVIK